MRIGFDAKRLFYNNTGLGNYSRSLVENISSLNTGCQYFLFTPEIKRNLVTEPFFSGRYNIVAPGPLSPLWRSYFMADDIKKHGIDIFHGLSHELPIGLKKKTKAKCVVTMHDLIYKFEPKDFSPIDRRIYDFKFRNSCKQADAIIAISQSTKYDLMMEFGVPEEKISVIYQSCSQEFSNKPEDTEIENIRAELGLPASFILSVGTVIGRKNILSAVKAMELLRGAAAIPLVIVGGGGAYKKMVQKYVADNNLGDLVVFPPYIPNKYLPALYRMAKIFVYPSRYEGFGIPIIESLSSGTPVITTKMSSLPEAAGPGAWYCDPSDPSTIAEGIVRLCTDNELYGSLSAAGYNHVQQFSAQKTAQALDNLYRSLI
jgi:glycosyltransferase involved in cell wall biosynthesis